MIVNKLHEIHAVTIEDDSRKHCKTSGLMFLFLYDQNKIMSKDVEALDLDEKYVLLEIPIYLTHLANYLKYC